MMISLGRAGPPVQGRWGGAGGGGQVEKPGPGEPQLSLKHEKNSVLVNQK